LALYAECPNAECHAAISKLVTPKAAAKLELLYNKPAFGLLRKLVGEIDLNEVGPNSNPNLDVFNGVLGVVVKLWSESSLTC
jgi:hypothetical protein